MKLTLTLAWRYLRGRGVRSLLTTLAVVFGVMLTFGLNGIMPTMVEAFTRNLLTSAGKVDLTVTGVSGEPFAATVADRLLDVPGIGVVSPGVTRIAPLPQKPNAPSGALAQVTVVGLDLTTASAIKEFTLGQGHMITPGANTSVVMNSDLAAQLNLGVGDDLVLPSAGGTTRFRVVGLLGYSTPSFWLGLMGLALFYVGLGWVGGPGRIDLIYEFDLRPISGFYLIDSIATGNWPVFANAFSHIILPSSILGFRSVAYISRMTRSFMVEQLRLRERAGRDSTLEMIL